MSAYTLPVLYSCGPAQAVALVAVPYNLLYAAVHKAQAVYERSKSPHYPSAEKIKKLEAEASSGIESMKFHLLSAIPIIGTHVALGVDRATRIANEQAQTTRQT